MSADNGIYILETVGYGVPSEYRVKHLQAIDNVYWDNVKKESTNNQDIHIINARCMWNGCKVFTDRVEALKEADRIYREIMGSDFPIIEYGISLITISRKF